MGNWNAYVESGSDRNERRARLDEVPEWYRKDVERHVQTVFAIRSFYARKASKKSKYE
jgi:hypothetical protein